MNYNTNQLAKLQRHNVTVALIDSGINTNNSHIWTNPYEKLDHIDNDNNGYIDDIHGWNFVDNTNNVTDLNGHGTLMASLITKLNNKVSIMPLKVLNRDDSLPSLDLVSQALEYAIHEQVNIIVIAIYFNSITPSISSLIAQAQAQNIAVITDSGNYGSCSCNNGKTNVLSNLQGVLTMGAIDQNLQRANYSQYGPKLDLMAPGTITENNRTYEGTSVATGFGAGAFSLLDGIRTSNATFVTKLLERTATDLNIKNKDEYTGYGLINISLALQVLQDNILPKFQLVGNSIIITDNIGLYKIQTPNQTIVIQGQNRSIELVKLTNLPYNISVQDLAGNKIIITIQNNKQASGYEDIYVVIALLISIQIKKRRKR